MRFSVSVMCFTPPATKESVRGPGRLPQETLAATQKHGQAAPLGWRTQICGLAEHGVMRRKALLGVGGADGGTEAVAFGIHFATAVVVLISAALLLTLYFGAMP